MIRRRMRAQSAVGRLVGAVDRLARTTGSNPVPPGKLMRGYRHERDKFALVRPDGDAAAKPSRPRARWNARCRSRPRSRRSTRWRRRTRSGAAIITAIEVRRHARTRPSGNHDGGRAQPHRSRQMAAADHELSAVLRTHAATSCSAPNSDKFRKRCTSRRAGSRRPNGCLDTISFAAIRPPPAIRIAAIAIVVVGCAKPARIRNAVDSNGVA